jgi:hypothetical protein
MKIFIYMMTRKVALMSPAKVNYVRVIDSTILGMQKLNVNSD